MSKKLYEETNIQDIADAIREKNGEETTYKVSEMAQAISDIPSGTDTQDATASIGEIVSGKTAYLASGKATGTMPNLDNISFGDNAVANNPGYTNPQYYEDIAEAINYAIEHGALSSSI